MTSRTSHTSVGSHSGSDQDSTSISNSSTNDGQKQCPDSFISSSASANANSTNFFSHNSSFISGANSEDDFSLPASILFHPVQQSNNLVSQ